MKLKKYMSSYHLYVKDDWMECVKWAKENGFDGIELFGKENGVLFEDIAEARLNEIAAYAMDSNIELSLHPWADWTKKTDEEVKSIFLAYAERCAKMKIRYLNMHMQFITTRENGIERLFQSSDAVLPVLRKGGQCFCMKTFRRTADGSWAARQRILTRCLIIIKMSLLYR